jgi:hypothetical protein
MNSLNPFHLRRMTVSLKALLGVRQHRSSMPKNYTSFITPDNFLLIFKSLIWVGQCPLITNLPHYGYEARFCGRFNII